MKSKTLLFIVLSILFSNVYSQVPTNGLVLHLPLNGNVKDSSSYANNGINYGAVPVADRFGKPNKAMYFNGTNRIEIPSSTSVNLTKDKTLSCWVYIPLSESQNSYPTLILKDEPLYSATYDLQLNDYFNYSSDVKYKFDFYFASGYAHYQTMTKQLYTNYKDKWLHIVATYDTISGYSRIYFNGSISDSLYVGKKIANASSLPLYIGCGRQFTLTNSYNTCFKGYMDEVRLYNRAISRNEVYSLYMEGTCSNSTKNDTTTYYVSSESFKSLSPRLQFIKTDSLKAKVGGCDSIINRYAKFEYNSKVCTITNSISVTDTLFIMTTVNALPAISSVNTIKIYPNPAKDYITIDFGDYTKLQGYLMIIRNGLGSVMYSSSIIQKSTTLEIKNWSVGVYVIQLFDNQNNIVETRKIIIK